MRRVFVVFLIAMGLACAARRPASPPVHAHREGLSVYGVEPGVVVTARLRVDDGTQYEGVRDVTVPQIGRFHFLVQSPQSSVRLLAKPFTTAHLLATVEEMLAKS